jgi:hypothetical protein
VSSFLGHHLIAEGRRTISRRDGRNTRDQSRTSENSQDDRDAQPTRCFGEAALGPSFEPVHALAPARALATSVSDGFSGSGGIPELCCELRSRIALSSRCRPGELQIQRVAGLRNRCTLCPGMPGASVARATTFVVRSPQAGTEAFLRQVQQAVWANNPTLPVGATQTMQDVYERSLARPTFTLLMLGSRAVWRSRSASSVSTG